MISWAGLLQFGLSLHYLASLSTKRFSDNSNRRYAEKGKKPPPPEVLPIGSRICRRRRSRFRLMLFLLQFRFQWEFKQDALRLYGNLVQIEKVQKIFQGIEIFTGVVPFDLNFFLFCDVANQITESSGRYQTLFPEAERQRNSKFGQSSTHAACEEQIEQLKEEKQISNAQISKLLHLLVKLGSHSNLLLLICMELIVMVHL
nr:hypothetical protein Iba_scaffold2820CG0200 [Ipomoea batatas]